ncbi:hypothetical protein ACWKW6_33660 [Dyadobacter jiangsuensis]
MGKIDDFVISYSHDLNDFMEICLEIIEGAIFGEVENDLYVSMINNTNMLIEIIQESDLKLFRYASINNISISEKNIEDIHLINRSSVCRWGTQVRKYFPLDRY